MEPFQRSHINNPIERPFRVLQFGGGNFLRAFADWIIEILNEETDFNGDVILVKPTPGGSYKALRSQQGLYHVVLQGLKDGQSVSEVKRIHCIRQILHPHQQWKEFLESASIPSLQFVISNTTESGIEYVASTRFAEEPPASFPAKLTRWLYQRFLYCNGDAAMGCIVLPCELTEDNGDLLKTYILKHAEDWKLEEAFKAWIHQANHFCNTLVDRIVSGYSENEAARLQQLSGFTDGQLVVGELYHSWVIQAPEHLKGYLPVHKTSLNVAFVKDLGPYRKMKVHILNAAHTLMVAVGIPLGFINVRECMEDTLMREFLEAALTREICPTLNMPGEQLLEFRNAVTNRFLNPFLDHKLESIALNSISKYRTRILPVLLEYYRVNNQSPRRLVLGLAALIWLYRPGREGKACKAKDSNDILDFFNALWQDHTGTPEASLQLVTRVLRNSQLWGQDISEVPGLVEDLLKFLQDIQTKDVSEIITSL